MQRRCVGTVFRAWTRSDPRCNLEVYRDSSCPSSLSGLRSTQRPFHSHGGRRQEVIALRKELKDAEKASRTAKKQGSPQHEKSSEEVPGWELTVGIEIHAQLNTARKLFSGMHPESPLQARSDHIQLHPLIPQKHPTPV